MKGDSGGRASGAKYVYIFMGLKNSLREDSPLQRAWSHAGLSTPKTMTQNDRYLADFETMYGKRPDYTFLQSVYAQVISERDPDCASVAELLTIFYRRLEALGVEVADLAFNGSNKTLSGLLRREAYRPEMAS